MPWADAYGTTTPPVPSREGNFRTSVLKDRGVVPELPKLDKECFFIAPIGAEGSEERHRSDGLLEFIVDRAAQELELTAVRADQIAEPGQITIQVIDHVLARKLR